VAGNARRELEAKTGTPVLSQKNYLGNRGTAAAVEVPAQSFEGQARRKSKKA